MNETVKLHTTTAVILLFTFLLGVGAGLGLGRLAGAQHSGPPGHGRGLPPPFGALDLSESQRTKVREIIESHREEMEMIMAESFPRIEAVHEKVRKAVVPLLTPDQVEHLHRLEERGRIMKGKGKRRPPPPP